jgi:hypothetical protein
MEGQAAYNRLSVLAKQIQGVRHGVAINQAYCNLCPCQLCAERKWSLQAEQPMNTIGRQVSLSRQKAACSRLMLQARPNPRSRDTSGVGCLLPSITAR